MTETIAYLVHDLSDAAVKRRVRMLELGGAAVRLAGFIRSAAAVNFPDTPFLGLGQTADAKLASRAGSVAKAWGRIERLRGTVAGADIIIARNLEMLLLAAKARQKFSPQASLVYECLDIHRLLLSENLAGKALRTLETRLWKEVDVLVTSSPAFIEHYFQPRGFPARIELVENKVLADDTASPQNTTLPAGPPWKIGYFGMLRCAKSVQILKKLANSANGAIEVFIRGKPSPAIFPNFAAELEDAPHVYFGGPYNGQAELGGLYGQVHFCWAVDYYEESQNSSWLLPNRLYESSYFGTVPIALSNVETGRWLERQQMGVRLCEPIADALLQFFSNLDAEKYAHLASRVRDLPKRLFSADADDCRRLVSQLSKRRSEPAWAVGARGLSTRIEGPRWRL